MPKDGCKEVEVSRYADPYHPTSSKELKTDVILGIAVAGLKIIRNGLKSR